MRVWVDTIYYLIMSVILFHIHHKRNGDVCGTKHVLLLNHFVFIPHVMWFNRPPVREMYPNYEVVVFQPWTVTPPHLGYVAYCYNFKLGPPQHLFLLPFSGLFSSLLCRTASPSIDFHLWSPLIFHPLPTSSPGAKRRPPGRHLHPQPASLCCSSLIPAYLHLTPFPVMARSPLYHPRPEPRSLSEPGGFDRHGSLPASVSMPRPLWVLLRILASSGPWYCCWVDFRARARGQGTSTPYQLRALVLSKVGIPPPHNSDCSLLSSVVLLPHP